MEVTGEPEDSSFCFLKCMLNDPHPPSLPDCINYVPESKPPQLDKLMDPRGGLHVAAMGTQLGPKRSTLQASQTLGQYSYVIYKVCIHFWKPSVMQ